MTSFCSASPRAARVHRSRRRQSAQGSHGARLSPARMQRQGRSAAARFTAMARRAQAGTSGHKRASSHSPAPSELRFRQYHCAHTEGLSRQEMIQFERPIAAKTEVERAIIQALLAAGPCPQKRRIARGGHLYGGPTMRRAMQRDGALERRLGHEVSSKEMSWRILSAVDVFIAAYAA